MKKLNITVILFFILNSLTAQSFLLDTTFKPNYNFNFYNINHSEVWGLNFETDGKLMIYGSFWDYNSNLSDILRIYDDGSLDNTWQFMGTGASTYYGFVKNLNNVYTKDSGCQIKNPYYRGSSDTG